MRITKFTHPRDERDAIDMVTVADGEMASMGHSKGSVKEPKDELSLSVHLPTRPDGSSLVYTVRFSREEAERFVEWVGKSPRIDER